MALASETLKSFNKIYERVVWLRDAMQAGVPHTFTLKINAIYELMAPVARDLAEMVTQEHDEFHVKVDLERLLDRLPQPKPMDADLRELKADLERLITEMQQSAKAEAPTIPCKPHIAPLQAVWAQVKDLRDGSKKCTPAYAELQAAMDDLEKVIKEMQDAIEPVLDLYFIITKNCDDHTHIEVANKTGVEQWLAARPHCEPISPSDSAAMLNEQWSETQPLIIAGHVAATKVVHRTVE